ncbi:probable WRKY transcription factor protein 1 [Lucilia cuprina]|uniref:probable WRKY transcription factor protein 1 n=1 Tax=Lucilia cuprina TaxID=7375 RepID=UPI001F060095|nr:probable WRKY transcription factor protein 1 [Lucilia cuprina]
MWNFQRIICIWICCVSCMFGTTQLSSLVQAVPYEYFDDHEQSFFDLDSEQIQAKYDTRLLSQQMLQTEQQQQQHSENLKGFLNYGSEDITANIAVSGNTNNKLETRKQNDAGASSYLSKTTTKLKSNDGQTLKNVGANTADDDDDDERNDWLEETATKAAATTSAITETLDELHLPRAASCFTNGQKYTHGQKVPRLDNCEVCLCMDGEIFCWWEKCDKKSAKTSTTYDDYSTPFEESSTTRMQLNPKTTYKTTLKPMKKPKTNEDYKYDDDDSAEIREIQLEYEGLKEQLMRTEHVQEQHKIHHNKQMVKKKIYQQQEEEKHNKKIKEQNKKKQEEQQQQQHHKQQHKTSEHFEQHHHPHNHNNNHDYSSSGSSSSKILNFPENLPSVLYYDYKTEEHHQHQHQHREQHLKHQKQKQQQKLLLQQHEKELKHLQQQQQQQHHVNRHHEYGQDFNTYSSTAHNTPVTGTGVGSRAGDETKHHDGIGGPSTTFKYFSNGNENIYNGDLQTDSDILPEPPTKKPKFPTSITDTTATTKTTGIPISQLHRLSTSMMATTAVAITKSSSTASATTSKTLANTPPTASMPLKKQIFSPWDYNKPNTDKINNNGNNKNNNNNDNNNNNNESTEDIIDTDDQDDAFHRWLTSTETNNKNNFTLNDAISGRDDAGGFASTAVGGGGSGLLDASNSDYNVEDRNYENFDLVAETGLSTAKATSRPLTTIGAAAAITTTTINAFDMNGGEGGRERPVAIYDDNGDMYENSQKPKYEQNFSDNNSYNSNNNGIINSNGYISNNNNNISPFSSNPYQNYNRNNNNNNMDRPTSSGSSSTTSNEDNGVASVVNIDIMLTASSADSQQQQKEERPQETNIETTNQHSQLQQDFEREKQIAKTQLKFMQPPTLISNTNDVDNNNPLYSIINDNTKNYNKSSSSSSGNSNQTITNIVVGDGLNIEERQTAQQKNVGVNLSSSDSSSNNSNSAATTHSLLSSSDSFSFNRISAVVSQTNATSATTVGATPPPLSTTLSPERQCNVMGTLYKIGDILPQDTGNCLQCICIDGSTSDDTPRVTCSPHNCPPLVLPDLFDATGY